MKKNARQCLLLAAEGRIEEALRTHDPEWAYLQFIEEVITRNGIRDSGDLSEAIRVRWAKWQGESWVRGSIIDARTNALITGGEIIGQGHYEERLGLWACAHMDIDTIDNWSGDDYSNERVELQRKRKAILADIRAKVKELSDTFDHE